MDKDKDKDKDEIKESLRERLIRVRLEHKLTQTEEGKLVDKSKTAVASWEQGLSIPDPVTLKRLAMYYEKTMNWMYGDEE